VRVRSIVTLSFLLVGLQTTAFAQSADEPPPPPPAATGETDAIAGEHMTMPAKRALLHVALEINLSSNAVFKPFSISPDIWYGVNDKLTVGLVHSFAGETGIMGGFGSALCLSGDKNGCSNVYNNVGLDLRYHLSSGGKFLVVGDGGLFANSLSPFQLALKLGLVARYRPSPTSKLAIDLAPNLLLGITQRDGDAMAGGSANKEVFAIPATLLYSVKPQLALAVQVGLVLPLEDASNLFFIPLSLGINYQINKQLSLDAAFTLLDLIGGSKLATGADTRSFTIGVGYAL
jgi:hypothetical protein